MAFHVPFTSIFQPDNGNESIWDPEDAYPTSTAPLNNYMATFIYKGA